MYQTLKNGTNSEEERKNHVETWGGYNDPLPNMTEITAEEFAQSGFFRSVISGLEFRQISPGKLNNLLFPVKATLSFKIFFTCGSDEDGFAITNEYWEKRVRYFKFAKCFHNWKEISAEEAKKPAWRCYHYCRCTKCGANYEYDSSD